MIVNRLQFLPREEFTDQILQYQNWLILLLTSQNRGFEIHVIEYWPKLGQAPWMQESKRGRGWQKEIDLNRKLGFGKHMLLKRSQFF